MPSQLPHKAFVLDGMLIPSHKGVPVVIQLPQENIFYIPLFDDIETMKVSLKTFNVPFDNYKVVPTPVSKLINLLREDPTYRLLINPRYIDGKLWGYELDPANPIQAQHVN